MCRPDDYPPYEDRPYIDMLDIVAEEANAMTRLGITHEWDLQVTDRLARFDPAVHEAGWSARLIFDEVRDAPRGRLPLVSGRQGPAEGNAAALVGRLTGDVLGDIGDAMRYLMDSWQLTPDSDTVWAFVAPDLPTLVVTFSANKSHGYIYLRVNVTKQAVPA